MKVLTADREREGKLDVEAANEAGTRKVFVPPPARSSPQLHPEPASPSPPPAAHASLPFFLSVFHLLLAPVLFKAPPPPSLRLPATPETGLVYSASSTSRLRAAVSLIFLPNICFFPLLIPPSLLLLLFGLIRHLSPPVRSSPEHLHTQLAATLTLASFHPHLHV